MKKIITPGIFLLATILSSACTDTDDTADDPSDDPPEAAQCCAPDTPRGDDLLFDAFDTGRSARLRFDSLRQLRSK